MQSIARAIANLDAGGLGLFAPGLDISIPSLMLFDVTEGFFLLASCLGRPSFAPSAFDDYPEPSGDQGDLEPSAGTFVLSGSPAVQDQHVFLRIDVAEVAGVVPAILEPLGGQLRVFVIAADQ